MLLHLHRPGPPLDAFVELVTYYAGYQPDHRKEKLLPDGAVEIIIDLTDTPKRLYDNRDHAVAATFRRAWISGMRRRWLIIEAAPGSSMVVIRFRPGGAFPFLGFDVDGITDTVDELDAVVGRATSSLRDRLLEAPTAAEKMRRVEAWLLERGGRRLQTDPVVRYVTERLFAPAGLRIADVVAEIGYSRRHVLGLFRRWVGLSPKQYGRIRRFQQVIGATVRAAPATDPLAASALRGPALSSEPDWAEMALAHGYYDQSHLIRDFREFAGMTPRDYAAAYRGLENYLPLD